MTFSLLDVYTTLMIYMNQLVKIRSDMSENLSAFSTFNVEAHIVISSLSDVCSHFS